MGELYGSLQDIVLPEILGFLKGLGKTGSLRISQGRWTGEASLHGGRATGASFNGEQGVSALEAIMLGIPSGSFTFTDGQPSAESNIEIEADELHARLSAFAEESLALTRAVPSLSAVPRVAKAPGTTGEVVLDGPAIETLLAVNGERTVAEIAREHGLVATARELTKLLDNGLISVDVPEAEAGAAPRPEEEAPEGVIQEEPTPQVQERPAAAGSRPDPGANARADLNGQAPSAPSDLAAAPAPPERPAERPEAAAAPAMPAVPPPLESAVETASEEPAAEDAAEVEAVETEAGQPEAALVALAASGPCPKLGYVDDPANRYSRPTQLHRCFASGTAERVSTPEQRDLCLTNGYPTCPRFIAAGATVAPPGPVQAAAAPEVERPRVQTSSTRNNRPDARPARDLNNGGSSRSVPARELGAPLSARAPASMSRPVVRPSPPARESAPAAAAEERQRAAPAETPPPPPTEPLPGVEALPSPAERRVAAQSASARRLMPAHLLVTAAAIATLAVVIIRAANPQLPDVTDEEVSRLATSVALSQGSNPSSAPPPIPGDSPAATGSPTVPLRTAIDVNFADAPAGWPNNPSSTAWFANGEYHVFARQPGQFVAIGALERFGDMVASATFRKVGGPAGGGYGFVIRDQGPGPRDGVNQNGQYYVLEVGDRGEYGIWRREGDRWLDLIPWTPSDLVPKGDATNEVMVQATGQELTFLVNGKVLANLVGAVLRDGGVGIFVGGDFNEVVVERFVVQVPELIPAGQRL